MNKMLLVVDDTPELLQAYVRSFTLMGYVVSCASSAQEALTMMHKESRLPHLVVSDYEMPGMKGDEFCLELKRRYGKQFPVILVSGKVEIHRVGQLCGADVTYCKPVRMTELQSSIETLLAGKL